MVLVSLLKLSHFLYYFGLPLPQVGEFIYPLLTEKYYSLRVVISDNLISEC